MSSDIRRIRTTVHSVPATTSKEQGGETAPLMSTRSDKLSRRAARFGKERRSSSSNGPSPTSPAGKVGRNEGSNEKSYDGQSSPSKIHSPRTFQVATERGGKRLMSEDEVSSLVHSALLRARQATSSFSPRARSSRSFGTDTLSTGSNTPGPSPTKVGGGPRQSEHEQQRSFPVSPSHASSRPPTRGTSSSTSPRKTSLSSSGLYVPRDEEMQANASLSRPSPRSPSFHTARASTRFGTPRSRGGDDSVFSFEDFHTPDQSDTNFDDHHPGTVELELDSNLSSANLSVTSTDEGMEVEDAGSIGACSPSIASVNSSEAIIRRVEEEIANARKAAQEANRRLAGVSANLKDAGVPNMGGATSTTPNNFYGQKNNGTATSVIHWETRKVEPSLNPMALLAMDDDDGNTDALFDSALNVIGEEFDIAESVDADEEKQEDLEGISRKSHEDGSDDDTSAEDRKWLLELTTDGSLENSIGGPDQLRLIASQSNVNASTASSFEVPYSPNAPDDERESKGLSRRSDYVQSTPIEDVTEKAPTFDDKDIVMSPTEEIESLLKGNDSFGEDSCTRGRSRSPAIMQRNRTIDVEVIAADDLVHDVSGESDGSPVHKISEQGRTSSSDGNSYHGPHLETEQQRTISDIKMYIDQELIAIKETTTDERPSETDAKISGLMEKAQETQTRDENEGEEVWLLINDAMEEKKSEDSMNLPAEFEDAPIDEIRNGNESPVSAESSEVGVDENVAVDSAFSPARRVQYSDPFDYRESDKLMHLEGIDDDGATPVEEEYADSADSASNDELAIGDTKLCLKSDCSNNETCVAASTDKMEAGSKLDCGCCESPNHEGAPDDELGDCNKPLDFSVNDASLCVVSDAEHQSALDSGIDGAANEIVTQGGEAEEDERSEQLGTDECVAGDIRGNEDFEDSHPLVDESFEDQGGPVDEEYAKSLDDQEFELNRNDEQTQVQNLKDHNNEDLNEESRSQHCAKDTSESSFFIYQVASAGSTDAVATARVPLPKDDSDDEIDDGKIILNEAETSEYTIRDEGEELLVRIAAPEESDEARTNESASQIADSLSDINKNHSTAIDGIIFEDRKNDNRDVGYELHEQKEPCVDVQQSQTPAVQVGDDSKLPDRQILDKDNEGKEGSGGDDQTTVFMDNRGAVKNQINDLDAKEIQEPVTPLARTPTAQILSSPNHSLNATQTLKGASSPRRSASPAPSPRRVALVDNRRALQSRANEARNAMCGESGGPTGLPDPAKEIVNKAKKVKFKQRYPVPPQIKRPRHPSEIVMEYRTEKPNDNVFYSKPKKDLKELLEAATGSSIQRRSNACGALKVLSTQKKNKFTLVRTHGFLDALVFAIGDNFSMEDAEAGVAARTRAVHVVVNVAEMKDNRYHVFSHNGLADSLVKCMMEDKGEGRASACAALAILAKTPQCRELMASTDKLIDVLGIILKGDEPSIFNCDRPSYLQEEKKDFSDDEATQTHINSFCSSSSSDNSCSRRESALSLDLEAKKRAKVNACAALLHLSKECSVSQRLCANGTLLYCLVAASKEFDSTIHTKVLEIICNLTRFPHNNAIMVKYPGLVDSLVANGKVKSDDDRIWAIRTLQNLSTETSAKSILANKTVLELLSVSMMRHCQEEHLAATAAIYNLSTEPGAVVPITNTKNVVATLVHVAHSPATSPDVRLMACDALATLGLWLQTLAGAGTVPDDVEPVALPSYITCGWNRWEA